jgi:hypothetical protein
MKAILAAVALVGLVTSSAFAHQSPQVRQVPVASAYVHAGSPHIWGAAVYSEGKVIGQDPDATVRLELLRDKTGTL